MKPGLHTFQVPPELGGKRLDLVVAELSGQSRSQISKLFQEEAVFVDNLAARPSEKARPGALVEVEVPQPQVYVPEVTPVAGLGIVYDDQDLVVVDKPAGVAAHTGPGWDGPTVTGALRASGYRISTSGPPEREGIVHRLDVGTSGLMVVAKSEVAYIALKNDFRYRRVDKIYHALVQGYLEQPEGTIDAPIGRQVGKEFKFTVTPDGKPSITHYRTLEVLPGATLVEVKLDTGRTHQIRVHFTALGHPLVGDDMYGADADLAARLKLKHQWLHAVSLGFTHPTTSLRMDLHSNYAPDLAQALQTLRV